MNIGSKKGEVSSGAELKTRGDPFSRESHSYGWCTVNLLRNRYLFKPLEFYKRPSRQGEEGGRKTETF